ncbi:hypothetical protein JJD41_23220 [Oxynema sp. CENA135]|uniref:hypothetical protein n=1 Tax=Oxynema sp. CENA135 TaxID=984206 RepID=UPI001A3F08E4|nr:hypothetical protein [Oxynema sp. CENA135]MBK4732754.1 hypothetical protein [Oxynema sp. CENA135]
MPYRGVGFLDAPREKPWDLVGFCGQLEERKGLMGGAIARSRLVESVGIDFEWKEKTSLAVQLDADCSARER